MRRNNPSHAYFIGFIHSNALNTLDLERDAEVSFNSNLNFDMHIIVSMDLIELLDWIKGILNNIQYAWELVCFSVQIKSETNNIEYYDNCINAPVI